MYAVVRVRGTSGVDAGRRRTLRLLRLTRPNHCVVVAETESCKGALQRVKELVTWGEADEKTLASLLEKRGGISKKDVAKEVKAIGSGKSKTMQPFRLAPPRKGWERGGVKKAFSQGGAAGYRGKKINDLLKRMI